LLRARRNGRAKALAEAIWEEPPKLSNRYKKVPGFISRSFLLYTTPGELVPVWSNEQVAIIIANFIDCRAVYGIMLQ
jgi:hypothetical protein